MDDVEFHENLNELSSGERSLLDLIWRLGPISRKELADIGGVTGASATRLTKKALSLGLIEESVERSGKVGNPQRPLRRSQSGLLSIGVSFTTKSISSVVTDIDGKILSFSSSTPEEISVQSIAEHIQLQRKEDEHLNAENATLMGIGLAIPGYRSKHQEQWAVHWDFPMLQRVDIQSQLSQILKAPVVAERDSIAAAWAERLQGHGKSTDSFCLMYLAQGVGGAVMIEGRPILGAHGNAGGIGSLFPYDKGPRPSLDDLQAHLKASDIEIHHFDQNSAHHNNALDAWIDAIVPSFRDGLNMIARLYDPEIIVLGGAIPRFVLDRLVVACDYSGIENSYTAKLPSPRIAVSSLNEHSLYHGAANLPLSRVLTYP